MYRARASSCARHVRICPLRPLCPNCAPERGARVRARTRKERKKTKPKEKTERERKKLKAGQPPSPDTNSPTQTPTQTKSPSPRPIPGTPQLSRSSLLDLVATPQKLIPRPLKDPPATRKKKLRKWSKLLQPCPKMRTLEATASRKLISKG